MTSYDDSELMTAGRFGSLTLLSAKALRIYAERGLLPPRRVDPLNGYRYYAADQVSTGWLISLLRSADLPLEQIHTIVHTDRGTALSLVERSVADLDRRTEAVKAVLARVRHHLSEETTMPSDTITSALETDRPVLSVQRRMKPAEMDIVIPAEVNRLRALAADAGVAVTGDAFGIFHAPVTDDSEGPLEIALPVEALVEEAGDVRSYRLSGGLVATRNAVGPETDFPEILALYDEVHSWITEGGRVPFGPPREIWHNSPRDDEPLNLTIAWPYAAPPA
jgi:DNA-binding transcriptional MerR regulator